MKKSNLRPLGQVTQDLEDVLIELTDSHELQWHEVLGIVHAWLQTHAPHAREVYMDDSHPEYYYGIKK